jgi:hypothetical protein
MRVLTFGAWGVVAWLTSGSIPALAGDGDGIPKGYFEARTRELAENCLTGLGSRQEWPAKREQHRRELLEMLGLWPLPVRGDLCAEVTGRLDLGDFEVERLHFQSLPGLYVTANMYLPKGVALPAPAILYVCGHGAAIRDGVSYGNKAVYHHHGAWFAREGYVCLMIDTVQLGEIQGVHHGTYRLGEWWWNSRGYTPAGVETWNGMRALDYLETRPEVDAGRIGMTGRSGGGAYTWYVAAVDDRVLVAAPVAGITDLENHVLDGTVEGHCDCMFMVNTYGWDYPLVAALVAPRPLLIANSDKDTIFPLDGVVRVHEKVKRVYDLLGASDQLGLLITEGPHKDTQDLQVPVFRWFNRFLKADDGMIERAAVRVLEPDQLRVFQQLPEGEINTRIQETFVPAASAAPVPSSGAEWSMMRSGWLRSLHGQSFRGWPATIEGTGARATLNVVRDGVRLEVHEFTSQPGVELRLYVARRSRLKRPRAVELNVLGQQEWNEWDAGMRVAYPVELGELPGLPEGEAASAEKPDEAGWFRELRERLMNESVAVAWLAPRGVGAADWSGTARESVQVRRRFMLLGQTLDGMRVWDIRRAIEALRASASFRRSAVHLRSEGRMGVNTLMAAVFEPGWDVVELSGLPSTFRDGPDYLNVMRFIDIPQAVAMAAEHGRVRLTRVSAGDWSYASAVGKALGWEQDRIVIVNARSAGAVQNHRGYSSAGGLWSAAANEVRRRFGSR